jgi:hypothetical protein
MEDYKSNNIEVNDSVGHRFRPDYPMGKIVKIEDGCNAVCWVDFGQLVSGKKHLTICIKSDIIKN